MTPQEFSAKWADNELKESAASKEHFLDVCALVGSPTPRDADKQGDWFAFEKGVAKGSLAGVSSKNGRKKQGFADVFLRGSFAWEYKGPHKDLDGAYAQLQLYRDALENPPLMIVSDMDRFMVRTNFNDMAVEELAFTNQRSLAPLRRYAATPYTAKHRIFVWLDRAVLPDHQLVALARDDDYFLGVLHSRPHELWALRKSNDMGKGNDPRYSPTVCFETFPLPFPPGEVETSDVLPLLYEALVALSGCFFYPRGMFPWAIGSHRTWGERVGSIVSFLFGHCFRHYRFAEYRPFLEQRFLQDRGEVVEQVPTVGYLHSIWSAFSQSLPVDRGAITGRGFYLRVPFQPGHQAFL